MRLHPHMRAAVRRVLNIEARGFIAEEKSKSFRHGLWLGVATQPLGWLLAKALHWLGVI